MKKTYTATSIVRRETKHLPYDYPQPEGLIAVREYLLTVAENERLCLLRWIKEVDCELDSMQFELIQFDANGTELARDLYKLDKSDIPSVEAGALFSLTRALPIDARCASVRVRLQQVTSGAFTYRVQNNLVTVSYTVGEAWERDKKEEKRSKKKKKTALTNERTVAPIRIKKIRFLRLAAFLTVILMAAAILDTYLDRVIPKEEIKAAIRETVEDLFSSDEDEFERGIYR